jgi:hypothetical protein
MHSQLLGLQPHTIAMSGLSRVRLALRHLLIVPSLAPHPVHTNGESSGHGRLGELPRPSRARRARSCRAFGQTPVLEIYLGVMVKWKIYLPPDSSAEINAKTLFMDFDGVSASPPRFRRLNTA